MRWRLALSVLAAAVIGAACSDSGSTTSTVAATVAPTSSATTTTTTIATTTTTTTTLPTGVTLPRSDIFVTTGGMGEVRIGMSVEEAEAAAGFDLSGELDPEVSDHCYHVAPPADQEGFEAVSFMVVDHEIVRVEVGPPGTATTKSGAGVGTTRADLIAMFPGQLEPIEVLAGGGGEGLQFVPRDPEEAEYRVVFGFEADVVSFFRAGILPAIAYTEGCL